MLQLMGRNAATMRVVILTLNQIQYNTLQMTLEFQMLKTILKPKLTPENRQHLLKSSPGQRI